MNSKFKTLLIVRDDGYCMGDIWHNEAIQELIELPTNKLSNKLYVFISEYLKTYDKLWIGRNFNKWELQRLQAIVKAKTDTTVEKKCLKYIHKLLTSTMYGHLFEKTKIEMFQKVFELDL